MFSVVIPLYNKEFSIKNTIQSVLEQTCQNFEIVIINDGSTDNSAKIVEDINDNRIRLIRQENKGVSAARNRGIKEAKYEWIAFLDADDLWKSNHLEEINKMIKLYQEEKVFATSFVYSDSRLIFKHPRQTFIFKIENYFKEAMKESLMCTGVVVINKECFNKVGGFNEKLSHGEDLDLWARLARNYSIVKSTLESFIYRVEAENRAGIAKDVKNSHAYYLNLNEVKNIDEYNYYKKAILDRVVAYVVRGDIKNYFILKNKYIEVTFFDVVRCLFLRIVSKVEKLAKSKEF